VAGQGRFDADGSLVPPKKRRPRKPVVLPDDFRVINILSLGAGVQSSTMALMAAAGEITPMPDCATFADTKAEPQGVYDWLDWLETQLPFPVYRVSGGDLAADQLEVRVSKKSGERYLKNSIPAYTKGSDGKKGLLGRKCTGDFKVTPIQRKVRELVGIKRAGDGIIRARMWIGISTDEAVRIKPSLVDYIENIWPLIDAGISRQGCFTWMEAHGYPTPPRSACRFCPFHSDMEWARLKREEPEEFELAAVFEDQLREVAATVTRLNSVPYLHNSLIPLREVNFNALDAGTHKQVDLFGNECEGLCGV